MAGRPVFRLLRAWAGHQLAVLEVDMAFTSARGANLAEQREALKLRPMAEFDPDKPARIYDNLNEMFFEWEPDELELLGWYPV
ncbi:MAG TPA: hypothetical protein VGM84_15575 [Steroidobacteraceae bacterium]|jgi:hypothetical protein